MSPRHETPPEPGQNVAPQEWASWAEKKILNLAKKNEELKEYNLELRLSIGSKNLSLCDLETKLKEKTDLCTSYEKVISSRKTKTFFEVGSDVALPNGLTGKVLEIVITAGTNLYVVGWWNNNGNWQCVQLPESEVSDEHPMPLCNVPDTGQ